MTKVLLIEEDIQINKPLTRIRSSFSLRNGIFSPLERIKKEDSSSEIYYRHHSTEIGNIISKIENLVYADSTDLKFDSIIKSNGCIKVLKGIGNQIQEDLKYLNLKNFSNKGIEAEGNNSDLFLHDSCKIYPGVYFDTTEGPIIIDKETILTPSSFIVGPTYIGKNSHLDNVKINGPTIIGNNCRIGGEIENSIINDFSNKHHEGFLGHSILGSWVNIGALATTSDLKNNYGEIRLQLPNSYYPFCAELITFNTGEIKFGSIIGDCVKIGIGTMINTGTVIDFGSNIYNTIPEKYTFPLSWKDNSTRYQLDKFIEDCEKIYKRRNQVPHIEMKNLINEFCK